MSLKLIINLSKKVPGPTEYSMISASCSLESELIPGQDPLAETRRLYAQAQTAVDQQLGITNAERAISPIQPAAAPSQPYPRSNRRAPPLITPAQRRLLDQLLQSSGANIATVLTQYRVANLDQLTCRDASALIDSIKSQPASRL